MTIKLDKDLIVYGLDANTRKDAISKIADLYISAGIVTDKKAYLDALSTVNQKEQRVLAMVLPFPTASQMR